jgi:hypothetical protein
MGCVSDCALEILLQIYVQTEVTMFQEIEKEVLPTCLERSGQTREQKAEGNRSQTWVVR